MAHVCDLVDLFARQLDHVSAEMEAIQEEVANRTRLIGEKAALRAEYGPMIAAYLAAGGMAIRCE